ncbi:BglG family transcription antiterminator [Shouchella hunanensis]|uniref:BglG family transcription antiterminator n=1 Tax=Shouchella hunanensis TaxID=766894 RepID=A0ABY7W9L7_9BACI|nr:BglG family transcription antiterminator [Shouchella hunanensis]WDF04334.1 BglG family transcription antiterminator [Shouchella hunanensis]
MFLTARERILIKTLLDHEMGLSIKELAEMASVSLRTVQRDLKDVEKTLKTNELTLQRKPRVRVLGTIEAKQKLATKLVDNKQEHLTAEERVSLLLATLLDAKGPVKLYALAKELDVAVATVSSDLYKASEWLERFGIELVRKRGFGVEAIGTETSIRRAMSAVLSEHLTEETFYHAVFSEDLQQEVANRLLHFVDLVTIRNVQKTLAQLHAEALERLTDQSYIALVVHITLAIERIRQGEKIQMDAMQLEVLEREKDVLPLAQSLAKALEKTFHIHIPKEEVGYLVMHLRGTRTSQPFEETFIKGNPELSYRVKALIREMEEALRISFSDPSFFQGLLAHLRPTIYRVEQHMKIHNPLLDKIKADYGSLFNVTKEKAGKVFSPIELPDEEIGFLTLHFGAVITRNRNRGPIRALVVCSSGIGSARMLSSRIRDEFPEVQSITLASLLDLNQYDPHSFDLFLSTVRINERKRQAIHVSPVLTDNEVKMIQTYLDRQNEQPPMVTVPSVRELQTPITMKDITTMSLFMEQVLDSVFHCRIDTVENDLDNVVEDLEKKGKVKKHDQVLRALKEREELGGLAIPNAGMALYHTRTEDILAPVFGILTLSRSTSVLSMAGEKEDIARVILMLAPLDLTEQQLAYMSYLSILLIESEEQTKVFKEETISSIQSLLEEKSKTFLMRFINEGVDT